MKSQLKRSRFSRSRAVIHEDTHPEIAMEFFKR
jgi:hypothetical protein